MANRATLLTRRQVAALLGIAEADVRARDNEAFHPIKGPDGSWRYPPEEVAAEVFIPLTVGGGVRKIDDVRNLLNAGADKVSINTAAVQRPEFVAEAGLIAFPQLVTGNLEHTTVDPATVEIKIPDSDYNSDDGGGYQLE